MFSPGLSRRRISQNRRTVHAVLRAALRPALNSSPLQRCQFHLQQKTQAYVPTKNLKQKVADDIRRMFNSEDRAHAEIKFAEFVKGYI